jgi:hypothetical protein
MRYVDLGGDKQYYRYMALHYALPLSVYLESPEALHGRSPSVTVQAATARCMGRSYDSTGLVASCAGAARVDYEIRHFRSELPRKARALCSSQ